MKRTKMLVNLNQKIIKCERCPRLVSHRQSIAKEKTKRFRGEKYWGKPLSGFGDPNAELLLIGLA
ncbi:MAG: uracil-DNA glycosylase, partial [Nitrosopumilaceae archaeon]